jgi:hypothetical protein
MAGFTHPDAHFHVRCHLRGIDHAASGRSSASRTPRRSPAKPASTGTACHERADVTSFPLEREEPHHD